MIDSAEDLVTIPQAARAVPRGQGQFGVDPSTVWRWHLRGVRGVRLETLLVGGKRFTSAQALDRFFQATTAAAAGLPNPVSASAQRRKAIASAERELAEAGI
jgi:Protein of unknown function (DUF1580)